MAKPAMFYHTGPLIVCEASLAEAVAKLETIDVAAVALMLDAVGHPPLRKQEPGLEGLVRIIISQQVSVASANAIFARVAANLVPLEAATLANATDEQFRLCGLSAPKMRAFRALGEAIVSQALNLEALADMSAEEAHRAMIAVKGIGPWTADIFLLFCLGHPDAWPVGDLALQEAARMVLGKKTRPTAKELEKIGERWRPLRGVAARMLWAYYGAVKRRSGITMTEATPKAAVAKKSVAKKVPAKKALVKKTVAKTKAKPAIKKARK